MKMGFGFLGFGILMSTTFPVDIPAQVDWKLHAGNPVIDGNFDPHSTTIFRPSVIFDGTKYHMWYGKGGPQQDTMMGYAISQDGIVWTLVNSVVLGPSPASNKFDHFQASQGWVIQDGNTFKMWYWGHGPNLGNIGYALSSDGITWNKENGPGMDGSVYDRTMDGGGALALVTPCVVKDGVTYRMWYARMLTPTFICRIAYAESSDGIQWKNVPGSETGGSVLDWGAPGNFDQFSVAYPTVLKTPQGWMMWYAGVNSLGMRVGHAVSTDGVQWTKIGGNGTGGACLDAASFPCVIKQGDLYKMWFGIDYHDEVYYAVSGTTQMNNKDAVDSPRRFDLRQNFPNPFNASTTISYQLPRASAVTITVFDMLGNTLSFEMAQHQSPGLYRWVWNGKNHDGIPLPSGIYCYSMQAEGFFSINKMVLIH